MITRINNLNVRSRLRALFAPGRAATVNRQHGFTLLELIVTLTILAIVIGGAVPVARNQIKRQREKELRRNLREIRMAIEAFHRDCNARKFKALEDDCFDQNICYPRELKKCLVEGMADAQLLDLIHRYLRRLPKDPMTGSTEWDVKSMSGEGDADDIFDVSSKSNEQALDGTNYKDW